MKCKNSQARLGSPLRLLQLWPNILPQCARIRVSVDSFGGPAMPSVSKVGDRLRLFSKFLIVLIAVGCFAISGRAQDSQQPATLDDAINGYESVTSGHAGVPEDWSSHHLIFSQPVPGSDTYDRVMQDPHYWMQQIRRSSGTKTLVDGDADYYDALGASSDVSSLPDKKKKKTKKAKKNKNKKPTDGLSKDWTENLIATGQVQPNMYPAKFGLYPGVATCSDFAVFPTGVAGSGTAATIVGNNNLYTTGCTGTVPSVNWAYNTGAGSVATTSPVTSIDGSQIAFIQSNGTTASLVLLKWGPNATGRTVTGSLSATSPHVTLTVGTFSATDVGAQISGTNIPTNDTISAVLSSTTATLATAPTAHAAETLTIHTETLALPGVPPLFSTSTYRGCTAPCMTTVSLSANDTFSSPYYDFLPDDSLYVGTDNGLLHRINGVFNGASIAEATNWPVSLAGGGKTASPVYDVGSGRVFAGTTSGVLYSAGTGNNSTPNAVITGTSSDLGDAIVDAPIVDSSAGKVYAFVNNSGGNNTVYQFPTSFSTGTGLSETVGTGGTQTWLYSGAFDNVYYSSASGNAGNLWVLGDTGGNNTTSVTLYRIPISGAGAMGTPVAASAALTNFTFHSGTFTGVRGWPSPITEFCNNGVNPCVASGTATTSGTDYLFFSTSQLNATTGSCPGGTGNDGHGCIFSYSINTPTANPTLVGEAEVTVPGTATPFAGCWATGGIIVDNAVPSGTLAGASQIYALQLNGNAAGGPTSGVYTSTTCTQVDTATPIAFQGAQNGP
jgi:hypothetical protein